MEKHPYMLIDIGNGLNSPKSETICAAQVKGQTGSGQA
jgi:hypothetical protein